MVCNHLIFPIIAGSIIGFLIVRMARWRRRAEIAGYEKTEPIPRVLVDADELETLRDNLYAIRYSEWDVLSIPLKSHVPLIFKGSYHYGNEDGSHCDGVTLLNDIAACRAIALAVRDHGITIKDDLTSVAVHKKGGVRVTVQKRCDHV